MARQLLPIRFLCTAAIFRASHSSSFSRFVAQLKLKDFPCSSRPCRLVHCREYRGGQTFSPRSARSGDTQSGKLRMGSVSGQSKSLIEDEAELSDWVSDIKKDAFHKKLSSEDESSARGRGNGGKDRDRDLWKSKGGERNFRPAAHGGPSSRRIRDSGPDGYSSRSRRIDSDESGDEHGDDFPRRMSNGRGNRPGDSYDSRRGPGGNGRGTSAFSKRAGGGYGIGGGLDRGKRGSGDYANGARLGQSRRDGGDYAIGGRLGQSKRGRGDYQIGDGLGQRKRAAPVVSKNDDDDDDDDDDDFLSDEDKRHGNRPGSTSDSRKRPGGSGRGTSAFSKRGERDNGIGERMSQGRRSGGHYSIGDRLGQSRRGGGDYEAGGRLGQGRSRGGYSHIGERPSQSKRTALVASNKDDDVDDTDDDDVDDDDDDDDDDEEDSDGPSDFGSDFFGDKEALKDRVAEGASEKGSSVVSTDGDIVKAIPQTSTPRSESYLSQTRFDQFPLSPLSLKGVKAAGYERMTEVQEATLPVILKGSNKLTVTDTPGEEPPWRVYTRRKTNPTGE